MSENDLRESNDRLNSEECSQSIRDIVGVSILGADDRELAAAGAVHRRKNAPS